MKIFGSMMRSPLALLWCRAKTVAPGWSKSRTLSRSMCGCVFRCQPTQASPSVACLCSISIHMTFSLFALVSPPHSHFRYPQAPVTVHVHVCVYVPPRTLGFPSGVYVWVQLTFCTYVPHPRSRGSHFSTSYRLGSTSRKKLHYSIMTFCSSFTIYWVWHMKQKLCVWNIVFVVWESTIWWVKWA